MKLTLAIMLLFTIGVGAACAQDSAKLPSSKFKHQIGGALGITTGYGLAYRYWPGRLGAQAAFAPIINHSRKNFNGGLTLLYRVIDTDKANLFLYQGNALFYSERNYSSGNTNNLTMMNGLGVGIEMIMMDRISFNIMGGFAGYDSFDIIGLTGELGLFYRF